MYAFSHTCYYEFVAVGEKSWNHKCNSENDKSSWDAWSLFLYVPWSEDVWLKETEFTALLFAVYRKRCCLELHNLSALQFVWTHSKVKLQLARSVLWPQDFRLHV